MITGYTPRQLTAEELRDFRNQNLLTRSASILGGAADSARQSADIQLAQNAAVANSNKAESDRATNAYNSSYASYQGRLNDYAEKYNSNENYDTNVLYPKANRYWNESYYASRDPQTITVPGRRSYPGGYVLQSYKVPDNNYPLDAGATAFTNDFYIVSANNKRKADIASLDEGAIQDRPASVSGSAPRVDQFVANYEFNNASKLSGLDSNSEEVGLLNRAADISNRMLRSSAAGATSDMGRFVDYKSLQSANNDRKEIAARGLNGFNESISGYNDKVDSYNNDLNAAKTAAANTNSAYGKQYLAYLTAAKQFDTKREARDTFDDKLAGDVSNYAFSGGAPIYADYYPKVGNSPARFVRGTGAISSVEANDNAGKSWQNNYLNTYRPFGAPTVPSDWGSIRPPSAGETPQAPGIDGYNLSAPSPAKLTGYTPPNTDFSPTQRILKSDKRQRVKRASR